MPHGKAERFYQITNSQCTDNFILIFIIKPRDQKKAICVASGLKIQIKVSELFFNDSLQRFGLVLVEFA